MNAGNVHVITLYSNVMTCSRYDVNVCTSNVMYEVLEV